MCICICRVGSIISRGNIQSVSVKGSGVSKVFMHGHLREVRAQLSGLAEAHLDPTTGEASDLLSAIVPEATICLLVCMHGP